MKAMRALVLIGLVACTAQPAPPSSTTTPPVPPTSPIGNVTTPGEPPPTARVDGQGDLVQGGRAFVIAPGFDAVEAYDPASGRRLWRASIPEKTSGRHSLHAFGGDVGLWAGNRLFVLDAAAGKLVRPPDEVPWNDRCWLDTIGGACAMRCECDLRVVDCATGRTIGPVYPKSYVEILDEESGSSGGCWGPGGDLVGRAGGVDVVAIEDDHSGGGGMFGGRLAFVGVELATGRELYRIPAAPLSTTVAPAASGVSPDGRTCHAGDHEGRLLVWDCASGRVLWSQPGLPTGTHGLSGHLVQSSDGALFRRAGDTATLHDERTGTIRWTVTAPHERATFLAGAAAPRMVSLGLPSGHRTTELAWLAPADGAERVRVPVVDLFEDGPTGGTFVRTSDTLIAYDRDGRERARSHEAVDRNVTAFADHLDVFGDDYALLDRDLHVRLRLAGSAASSTGSTLRSLAIYRWPPKDAPGPGAILLYSLTP